MIIHGQVQTSKDAVTTVGVIHMHNKRLTQMLHHLWTQQKETQHYYNTDKKNY